MDFAHPLVVAYGGGRDSTALLIRMWQMGVIPDAIVMADLGSEKQGTYEFLPIFDDWLADHGMPRITFVKYQGNVPYSTIIGNNLLNATLPGAAFHRHSCTSKWKIAPQHKWAQGWEPATQAWADGKTVLKLIGFEAGEEYRLRRADAKAHTGAFLKEKQLYTVRTPLIEMGIDLAHCIAIIEEVGLPVPPKSACICCPYQKPHEVHDLTPLERSLVILSEVVAEPYNDKIHGLWGLPRKRKQLPGSITEYILEQDLEFVPLTVFGKKVVLNPACQKAKQGHTMRPPHRTPTLSEQLRERGHALPEVTLGDLKDADAYQDLHLMEQVAKMLEHDAHTKIVNETVTEFISPKKPGIRLLTSDEEAA